MRDTTRKAPVSVLRAHKLAMRLRKGHPEIPRLQEVADGLDQAVKELERMSTLAATSLRALHEIAKHEGGPSHWGQVFEPIHKLTSLARDGWCPKCGDITVDSDGPMLVAGEEEEDPDTWVCPLCGYEEEE